MTEPVLLARGIVKRFGGVVALGGVDLRLHSGEIHGLVGENGAGKSTLVKILSGVSTPDQGDVLVDGTPVSFHSARDGVAAGIAFVAQELSLFPDLTVRENLFPVDPARRLGVMRHSEMDRLARPVLLRLGLHAAMDASVGELTLADQQLLEIGRALLLHPRVLILDEPTSAQSRTAVARIHGVLRALADEGLTILYISHFLEEVMQIADRVTVMRDSRVALAEARAGTVDLGQLVEAMLGGALPPRHVSPPRPPDGGTRGDHDTACLRLSDVAVSGALQNVSLEVAPGEIVGVAGLEGAGHETVLDLVSGRVRPTRGAVELPGGVRPRSLRHAYRHGVGFVPRDRKTQGLMEDKLVWENVASVRWLGLSRDGYWQHASRQRRRAARLVERLRIRGHTDSRVADLSGGNQQKVVFAKWIDAEPTVMLLDDPTRGVDIGARAEMHEVIRRLAAAGKVVLIASSDLDEFVELCHRVAVFQRGRVVDTLTGTRLDQHALSTAMNAGFVGETGVTRP